MKRIVYDVSTFNFNEMIRTVLSIDDLSTLSYPGPVFSREKDQSTEYHKLFYEFARTEEFTMLYHKFILEVIRPLYDEDIIFQTIPSLRISFPNNVAVGEFHKDKGYRDSSWAEQVKEDNFFLPLTDAFDTNTIWVESEEDKGDFSPIAAKYGECICWDGSNLNHGNKTNETGKSRVSLDFRIIKKSNYIPSETGSINTHTKFKIGGYYTDSKEI